MTTSETKPDAKKSQAKNTRTKRSTEAAKSGAGARKTRKRGRGNVGMEHIVNSTRKLLQTVPPSTLTRKSVAEASGVDPGLVRYYFSDLRHLLTEVLKALVEDYGARYRALNIDESDPEEALRLRIRHLVTFLAEDTSFHELFIEQIVNGQDQWAIETREAFTEKFHGTLASLIAAGRRNGLFREDFDTRFLYLTMIGAAEFLATSRTIFTRLYGDGKTPRDMADDYAEFLFQLVMNGIRKQ